MAKITNLEAREILDSRGNPTIEVELFLASGISGRASVPSGASTGVHEAHELRDGGERFGGLGVQKAVGNAEGELKTTLLDGDWSQDTLDQKMIELDGTPNKSRLGANAILGISLAFAKAMAKEQKLSLYQYFGNLAGNHNFVLPIPMMNILNGGKHADDSTDIQEFMVTPIGGQTFADRLRFGTETYHTLKKILSNQHQETLVGDEGGFAPQLASNEEALKLLIQAIEEAGYIPGKDISLAFDSAASSFMENGQYKLKKDGTTLSGEELIRLYQDWASKYPIISIEDGLAEDDWDNWIKLMEVLGEKIKIVGDDLFVTNTKRLQKGIDLKAANTILIKPNQIGTLTETIKTISLAKSAGFDFIISHRSGETEDTTIADLAVGTGAKFIKAGAPGRSERTAKYDQLLRIEEELQNNG